MPQCQEANEQMTIDVHPLVPREQGADFRKLPSMDPGTVSKSQPQNLAVLHRIQSERFGPRPALRWKSQGVFHDLSWQEYREQSLACAASLVSAGIQSGDRVGLLSENRLEWPVADMGILSAGAVNVPPHAPLTARQIHFQLADAGVRWLFVSNRKQRDKALEIRHALPELEGIVVFDDSAVCDGVISWSRFLHAGRRALSVHVVDLRHREQHLIPDDLATLMYTSGTTGNPKGVMLTHGNLLSNAMATDLASPRRLEDVVFNWLPFSHIYARTVDHYLSLVAGTTLCLAESADSVLDDLKQIQPTHMSSVPRLYEKVLAVCGSGPEETGAKLRGIFGSRIDWLGSGGAPLPPAVAYAYAEAGFLILQGYGLTESSPVISFNRKTNYKLETVGQAIPGVEIAIAPDGEVLTRGPHVMKGYWNDPEATVLAIRDGWLRTGDLGRLDNEGFLTITGRKKEILVLSNGKKVVPNYLEGLLQADACVDQVVIYGEGRSFLTALVVPHWDHVKSALAVDGVVAVGTPEALTADPRVKDLLARRIQTALAQVAPWEQIKAFLILPRPFSVEAEELTVSLKMRRNVIFDRYQRELDQLYST
jgi:long-chain acyl-CoA synthetase